MLIPTSIFPSVVIENVSPAVDGGRLPVKRIIGDELIVEADIFKEGHDLITAVLKWRSLSESRWHETPMRLVDNDHWCGSARLLSIGHHEFTIEAWQKLFDSWKHDFEIKFKAGIEDLSTEIEEGALLVDAAAIRANRLNSKDDSNQLKSFAAQLRQCATNASNTSNEAAYRITNDKILGALISVYEERYLATEYSPSVAVYVDRPAARFAAWYEFFPRSALGGDQKGATLRECIERIDDAKAMGFDVIYFPPIHPIGITKRKGKNNSITCEPGEPGSPYAIGSSAGGHKSIDPSLGTLADFDWLVKQVHAKGMEIALDFAINCSPDHPYVKEHPEWFFHRPDGTIKYAENPPKKYEDIYPLNFHNPQWRALWVEMRSILLFWAEHGVRIFRVDNPHTKPVAFWKWVIDEVHAKFPDVIFLSEAFTQPKMMKALAKVGFTQSYTYFTWRTTKSELTEYFTELTQSEMKEYFRGNLFTNTPDILPFHLQTGEPTIFLIRSLLAATLSSLYGIYSGFELCENAALPESEEYLDSEKYQLKARDWNAPGNIKKWITQLNSIRKGNRALHLYDNLRFHVISNDQMLCYSKATPSGENILLIVVNLDPLHTQSGFLETPLSEIFFPSTDHTKGIDQPLPRYRVHDLLSAETYHWVENRNFILLNPHNRPAHILKLEWDSSF